MSDTYTREQIIETLRQRVAEGMPMKYADWCLDRLGIQADLTIDPALEHDGYVLDADGDLWARCGPGMCAASDKHPGHYWHGTGGSIASLDYPERPLQMLFTTEQTEARERAAAKRALLDAASACEDMPRTPGSEFAEWLSIRAGEQP